MESFRMKDSQTTPKYKKCRGRNWRLQELMDVADSFDVQMTMDAETKAEKGHWIQARHDDASLHHLSVEFRMEKGDADEIHHVKFHLKRNSKRMSPFIPVLTLLLITTVIAARTFWTGGDEEGKALGFSRHLQSPKQNVSPSSPVPPSSIELSHAKPTLPSSPKKTAVNKPSGVKLLSSQSTLTNSPTVSFAPSLSSNPSTISTVSSAPSVSLYPSTAPSLSPAPSMSASESPTITVSPTLSWSRSGTGKTTSIATSLVVSISPAPYPSPVSDIVSTNAPVFVAMDDVTPAPSIAMAVAPVIAATNKPSPSRSTVFTLAPVRTITEAPSASPPINVFTVAPVLIATEAPSISPPIQSSSAPLIPPIPTIPGEESVPPSLVGTIYSSLSVKPTQISSTSPLPSLNPSQTPSHLPAFVPISSPTLSPVTPPQQYGTPAPIWELVSTGEPSPRATFGTTSIETPSYETTTSPVALPVPTSIRTANPVASPSSNFTPETTNKTPTSEITQPSLQNPVASPVAAPVSKPTAEITNETPSGETANEKTSAPVQLFPDAVPSAPPADSPTPEGEVPTNGDDDDMPTNEDDYVAPDVDDDGFVNPSPTKAPVSQPTPIPVAQPVENPTASPTASHLIPETPVPDTPGPVIAPTLSPTTPNTEDPSPVALPTRDPPVPAPTRDPPVSMPTRDPPVSVPTRDPPPRPTVVRTRAPVNRPVAPPVKRPTAPVANNTPTRRPAAQPVTQDKPIVSPSLPPSLEATVGPSPQPSLVPSVSPSGSPSISFQPTSSTAPSAVPTPSFLYEKLSLLSERIVVLAKFESRRLQEEEVPYRALCVRPVEEFVANSVRNEVEEVVQTFETLDVYIQNTTKELNIENLAISYTFDVLIEIRSFLTVHDMRRYIGGPFDSQDEKDAFVRFLRSTSCPELDQVTSVEIILPTELALADGGSKSSGSVIVGILVGIAAIALLAGTFVFSMSRNRRKRAQLAEQMNQEENNSSYPKPTYEAHDYMSEIGLQTVQDMSSLGDPIPPGASASLADMATLEPRSIDYDFREAYLERPEASIVSHSYETSSRFTSPVFIADADDVTLNAQYAICEKWEILAPSGFLGLVLETNRDGSPVVKSIRESSVLFDQVSIGDILESIDGQDVSFMLASDVSRLIGAKQDQQYRKMVFIRPA